MRFAVLAVLLATGCRGIFGLEHATAIEGDGPVAPDDDDAALPTDEAIGTDMPADPNCFGTLFQVCLQDLPAQPFTLTTTLNFDTTNNSLCATTTNPEAAGYCVFAATSYTMNSGVTLNLFGGRPMVIVATTGSLTINGTLDAASENVNPTMPGPGSDLADACNVGTAPMGAGGAPGGSFGAVGGDGARSNQGGDGGNAGLPHLADALRGGCRGANGDTAQGGRGGGAILLISTTKVRITGSVDASGAGGKGGPAGNHGGGGGGSGGLIVLDAPILETPGQVWANGGGGGGGSNTGTAGGDGKEPLNAGATGIGGNGGGAAGGQGGQGSHGTAGSPGQNGGGDAGGGGGGGGAGVIRFKVDASGGQISPSPQVGF